MSGEHPLVPRHAVAFVIHDGEGIALSIKHGGDEDHYALTIPEARAFVEEIIRSLIVAKRRRDQGDWGRAVDCRHGTHLRGRIEHALFYAMRDEFSDDEMDEYVADYADAILSTLGLVEASPAARDTEDWCLTHNKRITTRFVAAVCPNDIGCQIVPKPAASPDGGAA